MILKKFNRKSLPYLPKFSKCSKELRSGNDESEEGEKTIESIIHESVLIKEPIECPKPDEKNSSDENGDYYGVDFNIRTIYDLLERKPHNTPLIGEQIKYPSSKIEYEWTTYNQIKCNAHFIGSALMKLGIVPGQTTRIGIAGLNSVEYLTATIALVSYSIVVVPLYHNYKFSELSEIINNCELELIFLDKLAIANEFLSNANQLSPLKKIILMKAIETSEQKPKNINGISNLENIFVEEKIKIYEWNFLLKLGEVNQIPLILPKSTDIYIICHTSGTTGRPKGVQLSHRAILTSAIAGLYSQWCKAPHSFKFDKNDVYLSFLSPAHSYEQILQVFIMYVGGRIGVFGGDTRQLINDMKILRPTIVALVPRLLNKFYEKINADLQLLNSTKRLIFNSALKAKLNLLKKGILRYDTIWDLLVLRAIHNTFGGRLRLITTGGAPLSAKVMNFSRAVYGCPVVEGYGQTECSAAGCLSLPSDTLSGGHVGGPSPWAQVRLIDVPEMGYYSKSNKGEICFRGAALMSGYFNEDELTANTIDSEGWLHTGDIGEWLENGALKIIDRKKNIFKLAQGDFVAPESIENLYSQCPIVSQIFVDGKSSESFLVAIVVVNLIQLKNLLSSASKDPISLENLSDSVENNLNSDAIRHAILTILQDFGKKSQLNGLEQIRNLYLTTEEFSLDAGLLTPTLKLRRLELAKKFEDIIHKLYVEGPLK